MLSSCEIYKVKGWTNLDFLVFALKLCALLFPFGSPVGFFLLHFFDSARDISNFSLKHR